MVDVRRVIEDDGERDPRRNLALDEALARCVSADPDAVAPVLRLWRDARCVVVGRSQIATAEVDLDAAEEMRAPVLRRFSGGGTVWHDEGNLNVSLVVRPDDAALRADPTLRLVPGVYRLVLEPIAAAVRALGVEDARATEREVASDRGKLSGVAAWIGARAILVHATVLVEADLAALDRVCSGPGAPGDARWERTRSRRATVTSLARELPAVPSPAAVDAAVLGAFVGAVPDGRPVIPSSSWSAAELAIAGRLLDERYSDPAWHGSAPGDRAVARS